MKDQDNIPSREEDIELEKEKTRKLSIIEGSLASVSGGLGVRNISPFILALNASNALVGYLTSIPSLLGNASQLITIQLLNKFSRKKVVFWSVFLQSIFWFLLVVPGILFITKLSGSQIPAIILIALYSTVVIAGAVAGPAWNSWMKDLVPKDSIGRYFAGRSRITDSISFIFMILAGVILDFFRSRNVIYGFIIFMIIASLTRGISAYLFTKHYEPEFKQKKESYFSFFQFINNMPFNNFGRFVIFIALVNFAVAISSPFFSVFILKDRSFSYTLFMIWLMIAPIITIISFNYWGKFSDRFGSVKIMKLTGFFTASIPFIYIISSFILSNNWIFYLLILLAEIISGISWGGFNLSVTNFLFRSVSREKLVYCTAYMNLLVGGGVFLGASIGGWLASMSLWNPILITFLVSGICRFLVHLIMLPKIREAPEKKSEYNRKNPIYELMFLPRLLENYNLKGYILEKQKENKVGDLFENLSQR